MHSLFLNFPLCLIEISMLARRGYAMRPANHGWAESVDRYRFHNQNGQAGPDHICGVSIFLTDINLWFDDPFAYGVLHQLGSRVKVQFPHDILSMASDCFGANTQGLSDFDIGCPISQMGKDLLLP